MSVIDPTTDYVNKLRAESAVVYVDRYTYASKDDDASVVLSLYPFGIEKRSEVIVMTRDEAQRVMSALEAYLISGQRQKRGPNQIASGDAK